MTSLKPTTTTTTTAKMIDRAALAIALAYALTTVHHIYGGLVDSAPNRFRVPIIMAIPSVVAIGSLYRYRRTGSRAALNTAATVGKPRLGGSIRTSARRLRPRVQGRSLPAERPVKALLSAEPFRALSARRSVLRDHWSARDRNGPSGGFHDLPGDPRQIVDQVIKACRARCSCCCGTRSRGRTSP